MSKWGLKRRAASSAIWALAIGAAAAMADNAVLASASAVTT